MNSQLKFYQSSNNQNNIKTSLLCFPFLFINPTKLRKKTNKILNSTPQIKRGNLQKTQKFNTLFSIAAYFHIK